MNRELIWSREFKIMRRLRTLEVAITEAHFDRIKAHNGLLVVMAAVLIGMQMPDAKEEVA